jgi:hypothetical protein
MIERRANINNSNEYGKARFGRQVAIDGLDTHYIYVMPLTHILVVLDDGMY